MNAQPVSTTLYRSGDAVYNEYTGGVVGYQASGSIKSCTNRGSMISSSNQQYLYMGGIAGDFAEGEAENNVNVAKLDLQGDATSAVKGVRYASVGGLYGRFGAVQSRLPPALGTYLEQHFAGAAPLPVPALGVRLVPCTTVAGHCILPAVPASLCCTGSPAGQGRAEHLYAAFADLPPPPDGWEVLVGSETVSSLAHG